MGPHDRTPPAGCGFAGEAGGDTIGCLSGASRALRLIPAVILAAATVAAEAADKYQVVVHWTNPVSSLNTEALAAIFLKKAVRWPDGREVIPVDQSLQSPVREAFTREVLGDSILGVQSYWQQRITAGKIPPRTKGSDDEVQAYIGQNPTAIGYVSPDAKLKSSVKLLKLKK
jgi:ABC-type phosphate transport system substrate-binding protein